MLVKILIPRSYLRDTKSESPVNVQRPSIHVFLIKVIEEIGYIRSQLSTIWHFQYNEVDYVSSGKAHPKRDLVKDLGFIFLCMLIFTGVFPQFKFP